jgi:hypothetical protein
LDNVYDSDALAPLFAMMSLSTCVRRIAVALPSTAADSKIGLRPTEKFVIDR